MPKQPNKNNKTSLPNFNFGFDPYSDLSMSSETTTSPVYNIERDREFLGDMQGMSEEDRFRYNNPEAFNSGTIRPVNDNEDGGFRGRLADLSGWMSQGGAPTDFIAEATFIPSISRIFGDPDRGQPGAVTQVNSAIQEDPNRIFQPSTYLPMLDFLPMAGMVAKGKSVIQGGARNYLKRQQGRGLSSPVNGSPAGHMSADDLALKEVGMYSPSGEGSLKNVVRSEYPSVGYKQFDMFPFPDDAGTFMNQLAKGADPFQTVINRRVRELSTPRGKQRLADMHAPGLPKNLNSHLATQKAEGIIKDLSNLETHNSAAKDYVTTNVPNTQTVKDSRFMDPNLFDNAFYQKKGPEFGKTGVAVRTEDGLALGMPYVENVPVMEHEVGHLLQKGDRTVLDAELSGLTPKNFQGLPERIEDAYNYFMKGGGTELGVSREPVAFASELRSVLMDKGYMKYADDGYFADVSVDDLKAAYADFSKNPVYEHMTRTSNSRAYSVDLPIKMHSPHRIFDFMDPTDANFKLLAKSMNKLAVGTGVAATGAASGKDESDNDTKMKYKKGGWFQSTKVGRGVRDVARLSVNSALNPIEGLIGTDLGFDEKYGYSNDWAKNASKVTEGVGSAIGGVANAYVNTIVPGAGAALNAVGDGLENSGVTQAQDGPGAIGTNIGQAAGIFMGSTPPVTAKYGIKHKEYGNGGKIDLEAEGGEVVLTQGGTPNAANSNASMTKLGEGAFKINGDSHGNGGVDMQMPGGESIIINKKDSKAAQKIIKDLEAAKKDSLSGDFITKATGDLNVAKHTKSLDALVEAQQARNGNKSNVAHASMGTRFQNSSSRDSYENSNDWYNQGTSFKRQTYENSDGTVNDFNFNLYGGNADLRTFDSGYDDSTSTQRTGAGWSPEQNVYVPGMEERMGLNPLDMRGGDVSPARTNEGMSDYRLNLINNNQNRKSLFGRKDFQKQMNTAEHFGNKRDMRRLEKYGNTRSGVSNMFSNIFGGKYENGGEFTKGPEDVEPIGQLMNPNIFSSASSGQYSPYSHVDYSSGDRSSEDGMHYKRGGQYIKADDGIIHNNQTDTSNGFGMWMSDMDTGMTGPQEMPEGYTAPEGYVSGAYPPAKTEKVSRYDSLKGMFKGKGLSDLTPYASSAYNIGVGVAGLISPAEGLDAEKYTADKLKDPKKIDPYAQTAHMNQLSATYLNNESNPMRRQAYASSMAPKVAKAFSEVDYLNSQRQYQTDTANVDIDKGNNQMRLGIKEYNTKLAAAPYEFLKQGFSQASNTALAQEGNELLRGMSNTSNYSMGQYMEGMSPQERVQFAKMLKDSQQWE